jgi:hypothetical protein
MCHLPTCVTNSAQRTITDLLHSDVPTGSLYAQLISHMRTTCSVHLTLLNFITWNHNLPLYRVYHLKRNPKTIMPCGTKAMPGASRPPRIWFCQPPPSPVTIESGSPSLLGRCLQQLRKRCTGANMMYAATQRVFVLECYPGAKPSAALREAFSGAYADKQVPSKTTVRRLVTQCQDTGSVCLWQVRQKGCNCGRARFQSVHQLQQRDTATRIKGSHWFDLVCVEGLM